jgi:hypothetical protein
VLTTGASVSDVIEIIVYDVFSVGNFYNRTDSDSRYYKHSLGEELILDADGDTSITADTDDQIDFKIAGTDTVHMTSSGIGIGTASISSGFKLEVLGDVRFGDAYNDDAVELGWSAGASKGFVQAYDRGASAFRNLNLNNAVEIESGGDVTISDGDLVIGTSGHGINFAATSDTSATGSSMSSELFDDYEEGSWTPTLSTGTSSSYDGQVGQYTKMGRFVAAHFRLEIGDTFAGGTTQYLIGGLPYASDNTSGRPSGSGFIHYFNNLRTTAFALTLRVDYGQTVMYISGSVAADGATGLSVNSNVLQAQSDLYGSVFYYTAS